MLRYQQTRKLVWSLSFLTLWTMPALASDFGWNGLEVRGGISAPSNWDTGFTLGVLGDLGEITEDVHFLAGFEYATADSSDEQNIPIGPGFPEIKIGVDREVTSLALGAEVRYYFSGGSGFYVGGGPYLHRLEFDEAVLINGQGAVASVERDEIGLIGVGGYRFGKAFYLEARYNTVSIFRNIAVTAGIRFGG